MKNKIENKEEKSLDVINSKEHFFSRMINVIKKKWLISGVMTCLLIAIFICVFIISTLGLQKLELTPLDFTSEKTYTVTDESKEKVAGIEKQVNVYLIGYGDDDTTTTIAKQYNKASENINVEVIDIEQRKDIAQKYGIDSSESMGIIVECGEKSKVLSSSDLTTYDQNTYQSIDLTEEKLTASILTVVSDKLPKLYLLTTYSDKTISSSLNLFKMYLENEVNEVETVDILSNGSVPSDCDTLIITTPDRDFEEAVANEIIKYINNGGNILWFNTSYGVEMKLPNVNKVLEVYGIEPFETGFILEGDDNKMMAGAPYVIIPEFGDSDITSKLTYSLLVQATKINFVSDEKLEELKVKKEDLLTTSEKSFFRSDLSIDTLDKTDKDEAGEFIVGSMLTKTINEDVKSKLIIFGENYFATDNMASQNVQTYLIDVYENKKLILNSVAELTDREEPVSVSKTDDSVTYTATEQQDRIIVLTIFIVPIAIIAVGIIVWQVRRRKK